MLSTEGGEEGVNNATLFVRLKPTEARNISQKEFEQQARELFQQVPGVRISFQSQGASGEGKDLIILLKGEETRRTIRVRQYPDPGNESYSRVG